MALSNAERTARYRAKNKELCTMRAKRWVKNNPDKYKAMKRRIYLSKYGMTVESHAALWDEQGRTCAICGTDKSGDKKGWHIDHCHKTKQVRGILCGHCNRMLGGALDKAETLSRAINYLSKLRPNHPIINIESWWPSKRNRL
jgi:hypothetical protein